MTAKIIVSYDGTNNEDDAVALGRLLGDAGAEVSLAYVRHSPEDDQHEAEALLERGAALLGAPESTRHVVTDRSTPEGLGALAEQLGASAAGAVTRSVADRFAGIAAPEIVAPQPAAIVLHLHLAPRGPRVVVQVRHR